jgi:hypothetical protein
MGKTPGQEPSPYIYALPNDKDTVMRVLSMRSGHVEIFIEDLMGWECYEHVELEEQAAIDALFKAIVPFVSDSALRAASPPTGEGRE